MLRISAPFLLGFFLLVQVGAQHNPGDSLIMRSFEDMRQYASEQNYTKAKALGYQILQHDSLQYDVWLYMARLYGWEAKYDSAYAILGKVISAKPTLTEAFLIQVDLAYWENDWQKLEEYAAAALLLLPESKDLKQKYLLARYQMSLRSEAPELLLSYFYDHFSEPYERNWHMLTVGGKIPLQQLSLSPYVNGGFHPGIGNNETDFQFNLDLYLHLGSKNYMLAGYGISPDGATNYLPRHRGALELWQVLPVGFAVSGGMRYFFWEDHFTFLTFSGEKYAGDYWISLRNYLFFKDYGSSASWYLGARRYFDNRFNYLSATIGYGTAPDEPLLVVSDLDRQSALSFKAGFSWKIRYNLRWESTLGIAYEEFSEQNYRSRLDFRTSFFIRLQR